MSVSLERISVRRLVLGTSVAFATFAAAPAVAQVNIPEPKIFASKNGVLDVVMVAKTKVLGEFAVAGGTPTGWVYEICPRTGASQRSCPAGSMQDYGGARLALKRGDVLKVRLVNRLPELPESAHATETGNEFLVKNPTNIHTHGLIVSPRTPTARRPTFGDYVFVSLFNPAAPYDPSKAVHQHGQALNDYVDYEIDVPANHPSGLYFVHPHVHGIALNQISAGLSSLLTVGAAADYACLNLTCSATVSDANTRHITLKDTQILPSGVMQTQQDPGFCDQDPDPVNEPLRPGYCAGVGPYAGGKWFFTMNGVANGAIRNTSPTGEVWRLLNSSGSVSYRFQMVNDANGRPMPFQVLSVDGAAFDVPANATPGQLVRIGGLKLRVVSCPGPAAMLPFGRAPVCASEFEMMPSSRIEVWSVYRDANDVPAVPPSGASATFKSLGYTSGATADDGDNWPAADMAKVTFAPSGRGAPPPFVIVKSAILAGYAAGGIFQAPVDNLSNAPVVANAGNCKPLPTGWRRRIYFGTPADNGDAFGLGIQLIDQNGAPVGPLQDISQFDPASPPVCVPLAAGNTPSKEVWELINTTLEDHNFHIHQTKFRVIDTAAASTNPLSRAMNPSLMHDNIPVKHGTTTACDGTVQKWLTGQCDSKPVMVEIAFPKVGDFVFHCHILEHEDGGMMRKIQVVPFK